MLNTHNLDLNLIVKSLAQYKIISVIRNNHIVLLNSADIDKAQSIINKLHHQMPDLLPVQFHFMLNKNGFDDAIAQLLPELKTEDLDKYAMYKAYLEQARFYEFDKSLTMFNDIKEKFAEIDAGLDFTLEQLKAMWLEARRYKL